MSESTKPLTPEQEQFKAALLKSLQEFATDQSLAKNYMDTAKELDQWLEKKDPHAHS